MTFINNKLGHNLKLFKMLLDDLKELNDHILSMTYRRNVEY